jgi:hypothetical protein
MLSLVSVPIFKYEEYKRGIYVCRQGWLCAMWTNNSECVVLIHFCRHLPVRIIELSIDFDYTVNVENMLIIADSILKSRFPIDLHRTRENLCSVQPISHRD